MGSDLTPQIPSPIQPMHFFLLFIIRHLFGGPAISVKVELASGAHMAKESDYHVLVVDDSLIDRKCIEKLLLKSYPFRGIYLIFVDYKSSEFLLSFYLSFFGVLIVDFSWVLWITVVDSVSKALEFLGLQEAEQMTHHQVWFFH